MVERRRKILLVDGYNVINRLPELRSSLEGGLENARSRLALQVSTWSRAHPDTECVIVFDGRPPHGGDAVERLAGIRCIFSGTPHGGDAAIIGFVREREGGKSDITVVSDDNNVRNNCRARRLSPALELYPGEEKPSLGTRREIFARRQADRQEDGHRGRQGTKEKVRIMT